jgi:hypothetical protein
MSARFVTTLRARGAPIRLVASDAAPIWTLRVQSAEVWDAVRVEVVPGTQVREVKQAAMVELMPDVDDVDAYVVKLGGFEIANEGASLQAAGATDGSTLLIMARRRRPVR